MDRESVHESIESAYVNISTIIQESSLSNATNDKEVVRTNE